MSRSWGACSGALRPRGAWQIYVVAHLVWLSKLASAYSSVPGVAAVGGQANRSEHCLAAFWAGLPGLLERPSTLAAPLGSNGFPMPDQDKLDQQFFEEALSAQRLCAQQHGRYWSIHGVLPPAVVARQVGAGQKIFFGLCAPRQCARAEVALAVLPLAAQLILDLPEPVQVVDAEVEELGLWSEMHVDFVIAGFAKCATTALAAHLDKHPRLQLADVGAGELYYEDSSFITPVLLPTRQAIQAFQARHGVAGGEGKIGIKYPHTLFSTLTLMKLRAANPDVLFVIVLRDPVDWIESTYRWYAVANVTPPPFREHALTLDPRFAGLRMHTVEAHFVFWIRRLGRLGFRRGQLYVLHLEALNEDAIGRICGFLGVAPPGMPPGPMPTVNANPASTFDLCAAMQIDPVTRNAVLQLKAELASEYRELPRLLRENGERAPSDLRSRCERKWFVRSAA